MKMLIDTLSAPVYAKIVILTTTPIGSPTLTMHVPHGMFLFINLSILSWSRMNMLN